jgi:LDH2 family malate/lactate/ureidoglycolate dehydrogenase
VTGPVNRCQPIEPGQKVCYPGQRTWQRRLENEKSGIPVSPETWKKIVQL